MAQPATDTYAKKRLAEEALANPFTKSFIPKKKISHQHGKTSILVYPDTTIDMGDHEHCLAFNINKTAVNNAVNLNHSSKLQIMGEKHNCSNMIDVEINQWVHTGLDDLRNNDNLTGLSYHDRTGAVINDCLDINGDLKPLADGPIADCRPNNIMYAKVKGVMNFTTLNNDVNKLLLATFFIRLPVADTVVLNMAGNPRTLTTFNGPSDWLTINQDEYKTLIYSHDESVESPFDLLPPAFTTPSATIDADTRYNKIKNDIISISYPIILEQIFKQICPNFIDDPFATLNKVKQENTLANGAFHKSTVREFHDTFQTILTTFPKDQNAAWSSNPFRVFIEGLAHDIKDRVEANGFRKHMDTVALGPHAQMGLIQEGYTAACLAEKELAKQKLYIHETMKEAHGFMVVTGPSTPDNNGTAFNSTAENALSKFQDPKKKICWGCEMEDDHSYYDRKTKTITCPRAHEPGVAERAAMVREDFNKRRRLARNRASNTASNRQSKSSLAIRNFLLSSLDSADITKILATKPPIVKAPPTERKTTAMLPTFVLPVILDAISLSSNNLPQLPIPISNTLPHIILLLGPESTKFNPGMPAIIDTGAALCCGWAGYIMAIAKAYPELVKSITLAKDRYSPIILSGVVSNDPDAKHFSTNLPAVVEFHLPYLTRNGSPTSIKFAVGEDVSVNCLIGLSFIQNAKLVIDTNDNVVESKLLDIAPFSIDYRSPARTSPNIIPRETPTDSKTLSVIEKINEAHAFISSHRGIISEIKPSDAKETTPTVTFESPAPILNGSITNKRNIIRIPKPPYRKKKPNTFETENFPDPRGDFEFLHQNIGNVIQKTTRPPLTDADIDPIFLAQTFIPEKHQKILDQHLLIGPGVSAAIKQQLIELVKTYWCCFCEENVKLPIIGYQCVIDTGDSRPVVARNIRYGIHETPIMQHAINSLLSNDQICVDKTSQWLSRVVLAPKPHQEDVVDISDFIWRFCISFIPLNQVTKIIAYYIPRCDDAVEHGFGSAEFFFLMDACSGYHQIKMEESSSLKTAFAGPYGRKYRYLVMPFGVVNGPTVFVIMIYDQREYWGHECLCSFKMSVDENNNTTVIIDDTFGFAETPENALIILEAILIVSRRYRLSWKLKKCSFFPDRVEFVGHDLTKQGNYPASSKDEMLANWRIPGTVREISSFVGFGNFYSRYIPYFESRIVKLRSLLKAKDYNRVLDKDEFTSEALKEFEDIRNAILSKPCLRRVSRKKQPYLRTDFSAKGMGWVILQPEDDLDSLAAMTREDQGGECEFDKTITGLRLHPCAFGGRVCRGVEVYFHSYYGEAFGFRHGINKNRHILFARPFTGIGDCIAMRFILSYVGDNPVINRLLMELLGWWFTMCHRVNRLLVDADYFSRLPADLHIDPLLWAYEKLTHEQLTLSPPAATGTTVLDENLPNYRGKRSTPKESGVSSTIANLVTSQLQPTESLTNLSITNVPITFIQHSSTAKPKQLHHTSCANAAYRVLHHDWAVYRFTSGHFFSSCTHGDIPFCVRIGVDPDYRGRELMKSYGKVNHVLDSAISLLQHITSNVAPALQGYYISAPSLLGNNHQLDFLRTQSSIIYEMRRNCHLQCFVMELPTGYHQRLISQFITSNETAGWSLSKENIYFPEIGDCIDSSATFMIGFHTGVVGRPITIEVVRPPQQHPCIEDHIWSPFETIEFAITTLPKSDKTEEDDRFVIIPPPSPTSESPFDAKITGHLTFKGIRPVTLIGTKICDRNFPAPPLEPYNFNPFRRMFGIHFESRTGSGRHTRTISSYEYCQCFNMDKNLLVIFAKDIAKMDLLDSAVPIRTSKLILRSVHNQLTNILSENSSFNDSAKATATTASAYSFVAGATSIKLPSRDTWIQSYQQDNETSLIIDMLANPSLMTKINMEKIHYVYRQPLRSRSIILLDKMLYIREATDIVGNYMQLQIVPQSLRNTIFIAFHANPIGCHFDTYHTFHRIRLRYHWPHLHTYISHLISKCAGCRLSNIRLRKSASLVYSFPINEPFKVGHADVYTVGTEQGFNGEKNFMNYLCGMTGFAVSEPMLSDDINSAGFAKAIMKIQLTHGIAHTIVIDKDSKFRSTFETTMNLLEINLHVASGGNHDAVMTERFHVFLNKSLTLFCNERNSNRVAAEGILLCCYGWNSAPVVGTDLSRSLLVMGREFRFPIEYTSSKYVNLNPSTQSVETFAQQQEMLFSKSREIFRVLIHEHRAMHREYINSRRPDPLIYSVGDYVFARRSVQSNKKKGNVGKVMIKHTGPWEITEKLHGASYRIKHCRNRTIDKKHASQLSPCPENLTPFPPISGADTSFSQLNRNIKKHPYMEAGLDSYNPASPWPTDKGQVSSDDISQILFTSLTRIVPHIDRFPTLAELNDEMEGVHTNHDSSFCPRQSNPLSEISEVLDGKSQSINILSENGPLSLIGAPHTEPTKTIESSRPDLTTIVTAIINSDDKLFFINYVNPHSSYREWKVCQIDLRRTFAENPQAIINGKFLFNFLILHPDDVAFNAQNQRYWTEYHEIKGRFAIAQNYHLVKPGANTDSYCKDKSLLPFSQWLFIHHDDVYLHGPFNFATINGRKTRDRISSSFVLGGPGGDRGIGD